MKLGQLKRAFWAVFHQQGEVWFPYPEWARGAASDDSSIGEEVTELYFRDFLAHLTGDDSWTKAEEGDSVQGHEAGATNCCIDGYKMRLLRKDEEICLAS